MLSAKRFLAVPLFLFTLLLFTYGIASQEVIGFESRFYLFALEMWQSGFTWFPTTYQQPYADYPVSYTFLIYLAANMAGELNKFVAILPSAIAAALTVTLTYQIGKLHDKNWGVMAAGLLILTFTFFKSARTLSLDIFPVFITTACFYIAYLSECHKKKPALWVLISLLLLSFSFRGPIGFIIPAGVLCGFYLVNKHISFLVKFSLSALGALMLGVLILLSLAYYVGQMHFLQNVLRMEVWGRMSGSDLPFYYYWLVGLKDYSLSFPLALLTSVGVVYSFLQKRNLTQQTLLMQLIAWALIILIGMSLAGEKKVRYILTISPAIALLAAYPFHKNVKDNYFIFLRKGIIILLFFLPLLLLILLKFAPISYQLMLTHMSRLILLMAILQMVNMGVWCVMKRNHINYNVLLTAVLSVTVFFIFVVEPIEQQHNAAKQFVKRIEAERAFTNLPLAFYNEQPDGLPIKYLINMPSLSYPEFVYGLENLNHKMGAKLYITSEEFFLDLPKSLIERTRIIAHGKMAHVNVVAFVL